MEGINNVPLKKQKAGCFGMQLQGYRDDRFSLFLYDVSIGSIFVLFACFVVSVFFLGIFEWVLGAGSALGCSLLVAWLTD